VLPPSSGLKILSFKSKWVSPTFVIHLKISLSLHRGRINTPEKEPQLTDKPRRQDKSDLEYNTGMRV
jgi:hypothetical protein